MDTNSLDSTNESKIYFFYLCKVQLRNKIYSFFLLGIYLIVLIQGVSDNSLVNQSKVTHQHEDFIDSHHDHIFHVGIFHFLGHILESINQSDSPTDEHVVILEKTKGKQVINSDNTSDFYHSKYNAVGEQLELQSQSDPPKVCQFLLHQLIQPNSYLRGPPSLV